MNQGSRILWRCRRGIREMDLLLQCFVERHYDQLSTDEKKVFAELLDLPDPDIMDWIMGRGDPPPDSFLSIIEIIRNVNKTATVNNN